MKSLALIASRGSFNSFVQVLTLAMAAVGSGISVRLFVRDEAVLKMTKKGAGVINLSDAYRGDETAVRDRVERQGLADVRALLREMKELGDLKVYVCSSSLLIAGASAEDLIPEVDGVLGLTAFLLEDLASADRVLSF